MNNLDTEFILDNDFNKEQFLIDLKSKLFCFYKENHFLNKDLTKSNNNIEKFLDVILYEFNNLIDTLFDIPKLFNLNDQNITSTQLDFIGNFVGFSRNQCVAQCGPAFATDCDDIQGTQLSSEIDCTTNESVLPIACYSGLVDYEFEYTEAGNELYKKFIKAQILASNSDYSYSDINNIIKVLFDGQACIYDINQQNKISILFNGKPSGEILNLMALYSRMIPKPMGVELEFLYILDNYNPIGTTC